MSRQGSAISKASVRHIGFVMTSYPVKFLKKVFLNWKLYVFSKAEMESRRKAEEAERLRLEEQDRIAAQKLQVQMEAAAKADLENRERSV